MAVAVLHVGDELARVELGEILVHGHRDQIVLAGSDPGEPVDERFQLLWGVHASELEAPAPQLLDRQGGALAVRLDEFGLRPGMVHLALPVLGTFARPVFGITPSSVSKVRPTYTRSIPPARVSRWHP